MILKLACICWVWSKRIETQVKSLGNTFRELLSSRLHVRISLSPLGFSVYRIDEPESTPFPLETDYFRYHASTARSKGRMTNRANHCCPIQKLFQQNIYTGLRLYGLRIYGLFGFISVIWTMVNQILVLNFLDIWSFWLYGQLY